MTMLKWLYGSATVVVAAGALLHEKEVAFVGKFVDPPNPMTLLSVIALDPLENLLAKGRAIEFSKPHKNHQRRADPA